MTEKATTLTPLPPALQAYFDKATPIAVEPLTKGGSTAMSFRMRFTKKSDAVIKYLQDGHGQVDGHDLASFRRKIEQLKFVMDSPVGTYFAPILDYQHGENWSLYVTEFIDGQLLADAMFTTPEILLRACKHIIDTLWFPLCPQRHHAVPSGLTKRLHIDRVRDRLWILKDILPAALLEVGVITVNGQKIPSPMKSLCALEKSGVLELMDPTHLPPIVHGDLNLRNIIVPVRNGQWQYQDFFLIDPRGDLQPFDPAYDLAKMLFSVTSWHKACQEGFRLSEEDGWYITNSYALGLQLLNSWRDTFKHFDSAFVPRLMLSHACHALAEAACRISVDPVGGRNLALGFWLIGSLQLAQLTPENFPWTFEGLANIKTFN